jgi:ribosomal protein S14
MIKIKNKLKNDFNKRFLNHKLDIPHLILHTIVTNKIIHKNKRNQLAIHFQNNRGLVSKLRNRCLITARPRALIKLFKISRIKFKDFSDIGFLPGIKRSS